MWVGVESGKEKKWEEGTEEENRKSKKETIEEE